MFCLSEYMSRIRTRKGLHTEALQIYTRALGLLQRIKYSMLVESNAVCEEMVLFIQMGNSLHCVDS